MADAVPDPHVNLIKGSGCLEAIVLKARAKALEVVCVCLCTRSGVVVIT